MKYNAEDKYQSMYRAYKKLLSIATDIGKTVVVGDHAASDATQTFFNDCYHLKDWLKKDSRIKKPNEVENFINKSLSLSLAADLCNSFKHAGLDKKSRTGNNLDKINMAYSLDLSNSAEPGFIKAVKNFNHGDTVKISRSLRKGYPVATAKVILTIGSKQYDAVDLATKCIKDWNSFLNSKGIKFSSS
ncbi:MAG: hypothetical protein HY959_11615 [Ignavibacteriae bacterium]|nr:hypothetical protein [Ignavibacteriota bacterium]